jgi:uncharacterized repeat protein (TIGR01451 family)
MKFRRIFTPVVLMVTLLVQFLPGTAFAPRPAAAAACDAAQFVADVTIPDGTSFTPGAALVKTWRLKNIGSCTWSTSYAIVFYGGTKMGAPSVVYLPTSVAPGATVDVTVNMTAPSISGHYRGYWMLRNASNVLFGVGPSGTWDFFIDIVVAGGSVSSAYDFVANYCAASWSSGAGALPCPGTDGDGRGFVLNLSAPTLEDGTTGPAGLLTRPQNITDGYIQGIYPALTVQSGDHFVSIINCQYGATGCYVTFQLNYQIGSGPIHTLKTFKEKLDGMYYNLNVDLSSLAGQNVNFILKVLATGSPTGDRAVWAGARITRAGGPPIVSACDRAAFVSDVTIPDGTIMAGGTAFTKTWRLQNVGTCTWTTSYKLVFAGGDFLGVSGSAFNLPNSVAPGGTIDLSLSLTAPITSGNFISYWKLRNASGTNFGVGASGTSAFLVSINIYGSYGSAYDFVTNAGSAAWSSGAGALPFPGSDGDGRGFVLPLGSHQMEDGNTSSEGLLTFPQYVTNGYIQGIYPAFTIQSGDHFESYIGCQYGGPADCYIIFRLAYQIGSGPVVTLKTAAERYEGLVYRMDVDLSSLAGQNVKFILRVEAFGSPSGDRAHWSAPRIVRSGSVPPGPTPTPTYTNTPGPTPTSTPIPPTPTGVIVGPSADLSITINDSLGSYTPGGTATYTAVVSNGGPSDVTGAIVNVTKPMYITTWTVTCVADSGAACTAGPNTPAGNITDSINLPVGKKVTYTIVSTISASAVGNLVTTATITNPGPTPDPNMANNSATDTDAPPSADLSITKTDGILVWTPGGSTTYTVVVTNNGPLNVTGAVFNDNIPAQVTSWIWTCSASSGATCGAGSGGAVTTNIADTTSIPSGKKVTYTIVASLGTAVPGDLVNTATITAPVGMPDPVLANNSATDTDTGPSADLSVTKTDGVTFYTPGGTVTYTARVINNGPYPVVGAVLTDNRQVKVTSWSWTAVPDISATCAPCSGSANPLVSTLNLPVGQGVTFTIVAHIWAGAVDNLVNIANVTAPPAISDPNPANNTATDTDVPVSADLAVTMTDGLTIYPFGGTVTYTIVVSNLGPEDVTGATFADNQYLPITAWTWTAAPDPGASSLIVGSWSGGNFGDLVTIPAGKKITYTVVATIDSVTGGNLTNTATISTAPSTVIDLVPGNNTAVDVDAPMSADLVVTKTDGVPTYTAGGTVIYTITVSNNGPSDVTGATFSDTAPGLFDSWTWKCEAQLTAVCHPLVETAGGATFTDSVNIPAGKSITYTVKAQINAGATVAITNTASVTLPLPGIFLDPVPGNNTASDTDTKAP